MESVYVFWLVIRTELRPLADEATTFFESADMKNWVEVAEMPHTAYRQSQESSTTSKRRLTGTQVIGLCSLHVYVVDAAMGRVVGCKPCPAGEEVIADKVV